MKGSQVYLQRMGEGERGRPSKGLCAFSCSHLYVYIMLQNTNFPSLKITDFIPLLGLFFFLIVASYNL